MYMHLVLKLVKKMVSYENTLSKLLILHCEWVGSMGVLRPSGPSVHIFREWKKGLEGTATW